MILSPSKTVTAETFKLIWRLLAEGEQLSTFPRKGREIDLQREEEFRAFFVFAWEGDVLLNQGATAYESLGQALLAGEQYGADWGNFWTAFGLDHL